MARIKNIELPNEKHICIGLTAIYGIGRPLARTICKNAGVNPECKVKDLTDEEIKHYVKKWISILLKVIFVVKYN